MMKQLFQAALAELNAGGWVVLATIAASSGSTPRSTGAAMVVGDGGVLAGTIGGGALEYQCLRAALDTPQPVLRFELNHRQAAELGMVCGGSADVLFTPLRDVAFLHRVLDLLSGLQPAWLILPLDGSAPRLCLEPMAERPQQLNWQGTDVLSIPLADAGRFYLLGGGHVALELSRLLDQLGYAYLVADDRAEFSGADRFPNARARFALPFDGLNAAFTGALAPGRQDAICIMTRGHLADIDALRFALGTPASYIGVVGSRRKREAVFERLKAEGFADVAARVITPIGLPIGGQSPAEVALSIAAQLVQWRYQGKKA